VRHGVEVASNWLRLGSFLGNFVTCSLILKGLLGSFCHFKVTSPPSRIACSPGAAASGHFGRPSGAEKAHSALL